MMRWRRRRLARRRASLLDLKLKLRFVLLGLECRRDRLAGGPGAVLLACEIEEGREHLAELDRKLAKLDRRLA